LRPRALPCEPPQLKALFDQPLLLLPPAPPSTSDSRPKAQTNVSLANIRRKRINKSPFWPTSSLLASLLDYCCEAPVAKETTATLWRRLLASAVVVAHTTTGGGRCHRRRRPPRPPHSRKFPRGRREVTRRPSASSVAAANGQRPSRRRRGQQPRAASNLVNSLGGSSEPPLQAGPTADKWQSVLRNRRRSLLLAKSSPNAPEGDESGSISAPPNHITTRHSCKRYTLQESWIGWEI
jgi:hypothetical protein